MFHEAMHAFDGHGVKVGQVEIDIPAMMAQYFDYVWGFLVKVLA